MSRRLVSRDAWTRWAWVGTHARARTLTCKHKHTHIHASTREHACSLHTLLCAPCAAIAGHTSIAARTSEQQGIDEDILMQCCNPAHDHGGCVHAVCAILPLHSSGKSLLELKLCTGVRWRSSVLVQVRRHWKCAQCACSSTLTAQ